MIKRLIILFIILSSMGMFNIAFLGKDIIKIIELSGIGAILLVIVLQMVYSRGAAFAYSFKVEILLIFTGILLSMLMAYSGHNQGFSTTAIAQRFMYFYMFYFALHLIRISDKDLEKLMIYLAVAHVIFYMMQFMAFPNKIFDVRTSEDRGTLRIFLPGLSYLLLAYFYILNKLFERFSPGRLALLFFFFSIFILMGTRQIILSMFMLTMINVLLSKRVKSKAIILVLVVLSIFPIIFMFQDIFLNMLNVSQKQSEGFADDIRVRAATFFLTELFPNRLAYITGNGADSANSNYGFLIQSYRDAYGFYQSDVGLIGDYSRFGAFFVIGVFMIIYKVLTARLSVEYSYIKYFYINILLTLFTGGGAFGEGDSIVAICFTLYIIDIDKHKQRIEDEDEEENDNQNDEVEINKQENAEKPFYAL